MEEQKMNEKESLELIAQMIRVTKQSIGSGSGNKFLMYGYTAAILSIVIYALVYFTGNSAWSAGWFLMFVVLWYGYVDYRSGYQGIQPYLFPVARACHGYLYVYDYAFFTYAYGVAALFRGIVCRRDDCSGAYS